MGVEELPGTKVFKRHGSRKDLHGTGRSKGLISMDGDSIVSLLVHKSKIIHRNLVALQDLENSGLLSESTCRQDKEQWQENSVQNAVIFRFDKVSTFLPEWGFNKKISSSPTLGGQLK